jgi:surface polysaccharide O-acyltransferase-like enzyme
MTERRYDLDWLRVIATLVAFVFCCTRIFDTEGWYLKNVEQSPLLSVVTRGLIASWLAEIFFLLSGAASWYALQSKTAGAHLLVRIKRLLVPLYTVGLFVLLPPQFYLDLITNAGFTGTFWASLPRYFRGLALPRITLRPETSLHVPFEGHLWFLQYLYIISLVTLPLLLFLKSERGKRFIAWLADWCERTEGIFLFAVPLAIVLIGLRWLFVGQRTWAELVFHALIFLAGYVVAADKRFTEGLQTQVLESGVLWLLAAVGQGVVVSGLGYNVERQSFSLLYVLYQILVSVASWSAVVFVLGVAARLPNRNRRLLAFANEAVLPFYLLGQTIILIVGSAVISMDLGIVAKLLIVMAASFPLILVVYVVLVRPWDVMRFLFGMRLRERPVREEESEVLTVR